MPKPVLEVRGGRELRRTLRRAGDDMSDLKAAHSRVAAIVVGSASPPVRSGRLAGTQRGSGTKTASIYRAGFASVPYANPVHWGWPRRGIRAQTFGTDAAVRSEPVWYQVFVTAIERIIGRVKGI
jgi:hypothetical protein